MPRVPLGKRAVATRDMALQNRRETLAASLRVGLPMATVRVMSVVPS